MTGAPVIESRDFHGICFTITWLEPAIGSEADSSRSYGITS
ncbi:hypothetical protein [Roseibium denhamense]|nr:hypothetical protein [Roseibium denhamense]